MNKKNLVENSKQNKFLLINDLKILYEKVEKAKKKKNNFF